MLRRVVADEAGERNTLVRYWQEVDYLLRITRRHAICFVDVPTYRLRYHDDQVSATSGPDGTYRWMREQQILLRVVKRYALQDVEYYQAHRSRIDRHLAQLHRAVAVPMLLYKDGAKVGRRFDRYARAYLARCARYGHPARALRMAAFAPESLRRIAVHAVETMRAMRWRIVERLSAMGSRRLALLLTERAYV